MHIIIEVSGGLVTGVYYKRKTKLGRIPDVTVVDHDHQSEDGTVVSESGVEPLKDACETTRKAIKALP